MAQNGSDDIPKYEESPFKVLSSVNGEINRMSKESLVQKLQDLMLDYSGSRDIMKKRLKAYYRNRRITEVTGKTATPQFKYCIVIDFEATCDTSSKTTNSYPHEIIEFPAILVSVEESRIVCEFHQYCKPTFNPQLSQFCRDLTGISQRQVTRAMIFPVVLKQFELWLKENELGGDNPYAIVTDGPWDMGRFMRLQCQLSGIPFPAFARTWVNIRKTFSTFYKVRKGSLTHSLNGMLSCLGLEFEGRPHSGLADARNVARILLRLINDKAIVTPNEKYDTGAGLRVEIDMKKLDDLKKSNIIVKDSENYEDSEIENANHEDECEMNNME